MPIFERGDITLYYEEHGAGFPILLIAPGGMRSAVPFWDQAAWNPIPQLAAHYRVIAMDQRKRRSVQRPDQGNGQLARLYRGSAGPARSSRR